MKLETLFGGTSHSALGALALVSALCASAQAPFPTKSIRLVMPYPPGGAAATQVNLIAKKYQELIGNTIGFTAMNSFAINPHLTKKLPYDVSRDVQPITTISSVPNVIVVNSDVKANNLKELIALSKTTDLTYATPGAGTSVHLSGEMVISRAGLKMRHVPYRGESPALQDVLGGRVPVMLINLAGAIEYIRSGKLRPIAVTSLKRNALLPGVPTVAESALPDFDAKAYFILFGPRGLPPAVLETLNLDLTRAISSPDVRKPLTALGFDVNASTVEEATALIYLESKKWGAIVHQTAASWD